MGPLKIWSEVSSSIDNLFIVHSLIQQISQVPIMCQTWLRHSFCLPGAYSLLQERIGPEGQSSRRSTLWGSCFIAHTLALLSLCYASHNLLGIRDSDTGSPVPRLLLSQWGKQMFGEAYQGIKGYVLQWEWKTGMSGTLLGGVRGSLGR